MGDDIGSYLTEIGCESVDCIHVAEDRN